MRSLAKSPSAVRLIPYEEAYEEGFEDMPRRVPDLGRIRAMLGYQPQRSLEEIILSVIQDRSEGVGRLA